MTDHRNALLGLRELGQSVWLDYIRRSMLLDGSLAELIERDGLAGMTSNPVIFEQAIGHGDEYGVPLSALARQGAATGEIYESLAVEDVQQATDLFRVLYETTEGHDGYVSLEVSPHLARDADATVVEARRLWSRVARPNVMIKVPGTAEGLVAIRHLIAEGINVNVTLLFSPTRYSDVTDAWLDGLTDRAAAGKSLARVASVASFFLSRIDTLVDRRLDELDGEHQSLGRVLRGRAAIACARLAHLRQRDWINAPRWRALAARGAMPQRLLWASTSTKDPSYPDVKYVEDLIWPQTINTMPPETLDAYRDHGRPELRLENDLDQARALPQQLAALGIDLEQVAAELVEEGIRKFAEPFDRLLATIEKRAQRALMTGG